MPKVSVIIPVYNVEKYLKKCMDSVLGQTLKDIEIICIDDGSKDNSYAILKDYERRDSRIILLRNDRNFGQSYSRNRGIYIARGEYVQFVDSDDYIYDDALDDLYNIAKRNNLDLLRFSCEMEGIIHQSMKKYEEDIVNKIYDGCLLLEEIVKKEILFFPICIHFVKLELIKNWKISFFNGIIHEDVLFNYQLFVYSRRCMCINERKYIYNRRENSTTTGADFIRSLYGYLVCIYSILNGEFICGEVLPPLYATYGFLNHYQKEAERVLYFIDRKIDFDKWDKNIFNLYNRLFNKYIDYNAILENLEYIKSFSKIYIYGAGAAAAQAFKMLNEKDIAITGVIVSSIEKKKKYFYGYLILDVNEVCDEKESALILICVTWKYRDAVLKLVSKIGFNNVIFLGK